jgi:hypothetical protein
LPQFKLESSQFRLETPQFKLTLPQFKLETPQSKFDLSQKNSERSVTGKKQREIAAECQGKGTSGTNRQRQHKAWHKNRTLAMRTLVSA